MKLSIIIPAYNEEKELPACLANIGEAVSAIQLGHESAKEFFVEVIVADNNSTDKTSELARAAGAEVVFEAINQISRARNAGAASASGDWLLFIDADSYLHSATLIDLVTTISQNHCVGGGCVISLDGAPWWGLGMVKLWNLISRSMKWAPGSFMFCRADAFRELSGFSKEFYAAEEIDLSQRLKRWAKERGMKFIILRAHHHLSSGRKFELYSKWEILLHCCRSLLRPHRTLFNRKQLDFFYDGRR